MNECANFCDGFCSTESQDFDASNTGSTVTSQNASTGGSVRKFDPRRPPYNINNRCSKQPLSTRTLPVEATYYGGITDYNAHNLYGEFVNYTSVLWIHGLTNIIIAGTSEAIATYKALLHLRRNKRPFVLTRSNYPGVGAYAAHWNGELYILVHECM